MEGSELQLFSFVID